MMATSAENPGAAKKTGCSDPRIPQQSNTVSGAPTPNNSYWYHSLRVLRHQSPKCTKSKTAFEALKLGQVLAKRGTRSVSHQNGWPKICKKWHPRSERDEQLSGCASGTRSGRRERDWQWSESPIPRFREICVRGKTVCPRPIEAAAKAQADTGISGRLPVLPVTSYRSFLAPPTSPYYNPLVLLITHSRQFHSMEERGFILYLSFIQHETFIHPTFNKSSIQCKNLNSL